MELFKRLLIGLAVVLALGLLGFAAIAWKPAIAPIVPPAAAAFAPDMVARGEVLAGAGYCATCHTAKGGAPYAGGYPMVTSFGTIYSTNITPDPETGIGAWSKDAFRRAMHEGVARDGSHLFPAFPYDHFSKLTDGDVEALYAYMMTREPVRASAPANTIPFPLNIRALQAGWKLLFVRLGRFEPDAGRGPEWNRGAYLAEGISHCGACHTPRNLLGAEDHSRDYAGAAIDGAYDRLKLMDKAAYLDFVVEIIRRSDDQKGFEVLPRRWVVERTFGWMTRWRRLVRDYEKRIDVSHAMILVAMGGNLIRRNAHP